MTEEIRIKNIKVAKLFDRLTYDISFENKSDVSILKAPNGCGKTTIFHFINFLLNPKAETLLPIIHIPFDSFTCNLTNGTSIVLSRSKEPVKGKKPRKQVTVKDEFDGTEIKISSFWDWSFRIAITGQETIEESIFDFQSVSDECEKKPALLRGREDDIEDNIGVLSFFSEYLNLEGNEQSITRMYAKCLYVCERYQKFLKEHKCLTPVSFISANRLNPLNSLAKISPRFLRFRYGFLPMAAEKDQYDVLIKACKDASNLIKNALEEYNKLLTEAKNKLPGMYLRSTENEDTFETFSARWKRYHSELDKYHAIGLLPKADIVIKEKELKNAFDKKRQFLIEYLNAFEGTLDPLEKIYVKIKLFSDIFKKRNEVTHKTVSFSPNGIDILVDDRKLDIHYLSSGEKNDFVMFFQLIFMVRESSIILIDEPEISLHIEWQMEYLDKLIQICQMNNIQAIVATHSPSIVNGHQELFAEWEINDEL